MILSTDSFSFQEKASILKESVKTSTTSEKISTRVLYSQTFCLRSSPKYKYRKVGENVEIFPKIILLLQKMSRTVMKY